MSSFKSNWNEPAPQSKWGVMLPKEDQSKKSIYHPDNLFSSDDYDDPYICGFDDGSGDSAFILTGLAILTFVATIAVAKYENNKVDITEPKLQTEQKATPVPVAKDSIAAYKPQ